MKNILFFILFIVNVNVKAQFVTVTDTSFVNWLKTHGYSQCFNGMQLDTTCDTMLNTVYLKCGPVIYMGAFHDMDGIQYFKNLIQLECYDDSLVLLATLPAKLRLLDCSDNFITTLPNLPDSLLSLSCQTNLLTLLPTLPPNLNSLGCGENQIRALPTLPNFLTSIDCSFDSLTSLPELPDSLYFFGCEFNPDLSCLPYLKRIVTLDFEGTNIECLPDYGNVTKSTPPLNTLPLCDSINPNNCPLYTGITNITMDNFTVQPNPATNQLLISASGFLPAGEAWQPQTISIYNLNGQPACAGGRQLINLPFAREVDISMLPAGVYFVEVTGTQATVVRKFVKM